MKVIFLLIFLFFALNTYAQFILPSINSTKVRRIRIPPTSERKTNSKRETLYLTPTKAASLVDYPYSIILDYCTFALPSITNTTEWKNGTFCQKMFCEQENILFNRYNQSLNVNTSSEIRNLRRIYISAFYICKSCEVGASQMYLNGTFEQCRHNKIALPNLNPNLECEQKYYIGVTDHCYYSSIDQFASSDVTAEVYFIYFMHNVFTLFWIPTFLILLTITFFLNFIPTLIEQIRSFRNPLLEVMKKVKFFFSFQNANLSFLILLEVISLIVLVAERFDQTPLYSAVYFVGYFFLIVIFGVIIMLLTHVTTASTSTLDQPLQLKEWILLICIFGSIIILGLIGLILYIVGIVLFDPLILLLFTLWKLSIVILLLTLGIILFFVSFFLFLKITFGEQKKTDVYLKLKFNQVMIAFNIGFIALNVIFLVSSLLEVIEYFSYQVPYVNLLISDFLLFFPLVYLCVVVNFSMVSIKQLKLAYGCCCKQEE